MKEIQGLYDPTLLLNVVSRQFPSNQQVQFISQICCQPECDLSDDAICCTLINLSLRFKTNDSRKMMISSYTKGIFVYYFAIIFNEIYCLLFCKCK